MENNKKRPYFFNLKGNDDSAIVRLLHSSVETIESIDTHKIVLNDKPSRVKCLGENCPFCKSGKDIDKRIYIHLFDYTDNTEKVWDRTDKIIPQLEELYKSWNPLSSAILKITRVGDSFPKYIITPQNPMMYNDVDASLIDEKVGRRFSLSKTAEEISEFLNTGKFPERKEYVPKETYNKMTDKEKESFKSQQSESNNTDNAGQNSNTDQFDPIPDFDDLPF